MKADVSGNPFGMDQQAFNTLVSETIQPPGVVPSDGSPYRVHLAFNGSTIVIRTAYPGADAEKEAARAEVDDREQRLHQHFQDHRHGQQQDRAVELFLRLSVLGGVDHDVFGRAFHAGRRLVNHDA